MRYALTNRSLGFVLALVIAGVWTSAFAQTRLTVNDPRPVAKALEEIETRYGWQITYEDPPYGHPSDVVEMDPRLRRERIDADTSQLLIPRGGTLTVNLPTATPTATPRGRQQAVAAEVIGKFNAAHGEIFALSGDDRLLHVSPRQVKSASGKLEKITPLLDTAVTIAAEQRTALLLFNEICKALAAETKADVTLGTVPVNYLRGMQTSLGASGESARSLLARIVLSADRPLSWQLFYDPGSKLYVLNMHIVEKGRTR